MSFDRLRQAIYPPPPPLLQAKIHWPNNSSVETYVRIPGLGRYVEAWASRSSALEALIYWLGKMTGNRAQPLFMPGRGTHTAVGKRVLVGFNMVEL